jgi:hypothetical protein
MNEFVSVPGIWFFGAALVIGFAILMLGFFVKSAVRVQVPVFSVPNSESNSGQFPNVTDDELIKAVRALTYEEQALLMLALPVSEAVRVERLFPPGNGKLVVMDGVERIKKSGENFNNHAASMVLKKFLKDLSPLMIAFVLLSTSFAFAEETSAVKYTPKIGLRFNGGLMQNTGTSRGSASIVYGLNFFGLYYPSSDFALGAGYKFFFDQVKLNVPVNGFFLVGRMYVAGQGTRAEIDADRMVAESHGKYAFYLGTQFDRSSYYLGTDPSRTTQKLTGDFLAINALLGMELRLSHRLELNVEGSAGLVAFAASDERYKVSGYILNAGISYLW